MIKLYYSPNSCSMSAHIALEIIGQPYEAFNVRKMWEEFLKINPKRSVPTIKDENEKIYTQNSAILKYLAQKFSEANMWWDGTPEQTYEMNNWLSFTWWDLHPAHSPFFSAWNYTSFTDKEFLDDIKKTSFKNVKKQLEHLEKWLKWRDFLVGNTITIADMYTFPVSRWYSLFMKKSMSSFPNILKYQERMSKNTAVAKVLSIHNPKNK